MSLDRKITDLLPAQIPDYVQEFYPMFVIFVTKYFEWLEQDGNPQEIIQNITLNRDIDTTASSLATKFVATYAPNLPQSASLDRPTLVKNFRDFYRAKGSVKSFEFFFRAFYGDEIKVKLPGNQLFKTSDGNWYVEKTLRVLEDVGSPEDLLHTTITGSESGATGIVEKAVKTYGKWDLTLQNRSLTGTFSSSETITGYLWDFENDVSSLVSVINTEPLNIAPGRQLGTNSLLSSDQIIQDSVYWQKFSYVISTRINLSQWKDAILEQLHPTGRNMFGELYIDNTSSITATSTFVRNTAIETQVKLFGDSSQFYVVPGVTWDRLANFKTGTSATTSAGSVSYDAAYTFGGENITFALQGQADAAVAYQEQMIFTSVTGLISVDMTTGVTASGRDQVSYVMPITSITGTLNAVAQAGGEITFTGTGTLFTAELPIDNNWRYYNGERDVAQNPVYSLYSSVLTVKNLPITGTLTIAAQTPVAPNYYIYATGTGTQFQSDLLVAGTSATVSREIDRPILDNGQDPITISISNMTLGGDITFNAGEVTATGINTNFNLLQPGKTITVAKPISGRVTQVSTIPATATSYSTVFTSESIAPGDIVGTSLATHLTTSAASALRASYTIAGVDRSARYDIPVPFSIELLGTSTNTLYVHSAGVIALASSAPFVYIYDGLAVNKPHISLNGGGLNNLNDVYYESFGSTPNRQFKVFMNSTQYRPYYTTLSTDAFALEWPDFKGTTQLTSATIRGAAALGTAITAMTTGTATNGYRTITLPWKFYYNGVSSDLVYLAHNGNMAFGTAVTINTSLGYGYWTINELSSGTTTIDAGNLHYNNNVGNYIVPLNLSIDGTYGIDAVPKKMIKIYSATVGTAPNRVHVIRYEGNSSTAATTGQVMWEANFYESDNSSMTLNYAGGPESTFWLSETDVYYYRGRTNVVVNPSNGGLVVTSTTTVDNWFVNDYWTYDSAYTYRIATSASTVQYLYQPTISRKNYEVTFHENSSSGVTVKTDFIYTPYTASSPRYRYGRTSGTTYSFAIELAESTTSSPSTQVTGVASITTLRSYNFKPQKIPATAEINSSIPATTSDFVLVSLANYEAGTDYSYRTVYLTDFSSLDITSNGAVARWPRDGWSATAANTNPNPTCSSSAIMNYSYVVSQWVSGYFYGGGYWLHRWYSSNANVFTFEYGSSATTHSRFIQTKTTYGKRHQINLAVWRGNNTGTWNTTTSWNTLSAPVTGQDLELWYSTADIAPVVPNPGQSPSARGWTKYSTLLAGGTSTVSVGPTITLSSNTARNLTWLIWQTSFSSQTTSAAASLSAYAIDALDVYADWFNTSSVSDVVGTFAQSSVMPRAVTELTSGSILRIPVLSGRTSNTVTVDFVVSKNPADFGPVTGNQYLVLKATTSVPVTGYVNEWYTSSATSYGTYFLGLQSAPALILEQRTVDTVYSDTSFTVTTSWSSTSNRYWSDGSGIGVAARTFNVVSIPSSNSIILTSPTNSSLAINAGVTGVEATADRRFTILYINNDNDITVSGGGIHANFTGLSAISPKIETGNLLITGDHNQSNQTSDTTWLSVGFPGYNADNTFLGNEFQNRTTMTIGGSSFTVVSVLSDTAMLVTGSPIIANFYDTSMLSYFPAPSVESTMYGTGTKFELSSTTVSSLTTTTEEVTVYDGTDRRIGFIRVNGVDYRILDIVDSSTLVVSHSVPIVDSVVGQSGSAFKRSREYGSPRQFARAGAGTFDSAGNNITVDESLIAQGNFVDFTKYLELYHSTTSFTLTTGASILATSITIKASNDSSAIATMSSYLLLVTWMKDLADNADNEILNELQIAVTSNAGTFTFDATDEVQRDSKDIALGRTLMYSDTIYVNSSNSITLIGDSSGTTSVSVNWIPFNRTRSGTYGRVAMRLSSVFATSAVTTATITVNLSVLNAWNATSSDFLNVTVIGAE